MIDNNDDKNEIVVQLRFKAFNFLFKRWDCEIQLSPSNILNKDVICKKISPINFIVLDKLDMTFSKNEFDTLLWNQNIYYRAKRILPEGYIKEWAGDERSDSVKK